MQKLFIYSVSHLCENEVVCSGNVFGGHGVFNSFEVLFACQEVLFLNLKKFFLCAQLALYVCVSDLV